MRVFIQKRSDPIYPYTIVFTDDKLAKKTKSFVLGSLFRKLKVGEYLEVGDEIPPLRDSKLFGKKKIVIGLTRDPTG